MFVEIATNSCQNLRSLSPHLTVLLLPTLTGSCIFYRNGTVLVDVEAATYRWEMVPEMVEWRDVYVLLDVDPFNPRNMTSMPLMRVTARGGLLGMLQGSNARRGGIATIPIAPHVASCRTVGSGWQ